jgi:hypothetical protein
VLKKKTAGKFLNFLPSEVETLKIKKLIGGATRNH